MVEGEIAHRKAIASIYGTSGGRTGLKLLQELADTQPNYGYFPVLVECGRIRHEPGRVIPGAQKL